MNRSLLAQRLHWKEPCPKKVKTARFLKRFFPSMIKKSTILLISTLLSLRWFIAGLPGYIHPDEFFQNPEITSSRIFGIQTFTPWEYQPQNAARSIVAP